VELGVIACVVAACSLALGVWNFIAISERLKEGDLEPMLSKRVEELSKDYGRRLREIEVEWDNMFDKFSKLAGRIDRRRALESPPPPSQKDTPPGELAPPENLRGVKKKEENCQEYRRTSTQGIPISKTQTERGRQREKDFTATLGKPRKN